MYGEKYGEYAYSTYTLVLKICISFELGCLLSISDYKYHREASSK